MIRQRNIARAVYHRCIAVQDPVVRLRMGVERYVADAIAADREKLAFVQP